MLLYTFQDAWFFPKECWLNDKAAPGQAGSALQQMPK